MTYTAKNAREAIIEKEKEEIRKNSPEALKQNLNSQAIETLVVWHRKIKDAAEKGENSCRISGSWSSVEYSWDIPWCLFNGQFFPPHKIPKRPNLLESILGTVPDEILDPNYSEKLRKWLCDEGNLLESIKIVVAQLREEGFSIKVEGEFSKMFYRPAAWLIIKW